MADNPALIQFPFAGGIKEGVRDELLEPGQGWALLENGRQDHVGAYSTRNGFAAFATTRVDGTSPAIGMRLFADRTLLARIVDGPTIESYSSTLAKWQSHGRVPNASCRLIPLPNAGSSTTLEDVDSVNGYVAATWLVLSGGNGSAYAAIVDETTGAVLRAPELVGSGTGLGYPLLATYGTYFVLVRYDAANTIHAWYLDTTSATTINAGWVAFSTPLVVDADTLFTYAVQGLTSRFALVYANTSAGTDKATVISCTVAGVTQTKTINTSSALPDHVAIAGSISDTLWVAWNEGTDVKVCGLSPTTITTVLATTLTAFALTTGVTQISIAASATAGKARLWANETPVVGRLNAKMRGITTSGGAAAGDGAAVTVPNAQMFRKPIAYDGRYYSLFFGGDSTNTQANAIVCDWTEDATTLRPVANPGQDLAALGTYGKGKILAVATGRYVLGMGITRSGAATASHLVEVDFLGPRRWLPAAAGDSLYLSGGLLSYFDGVRVAEAGFLMRPKTPTIANAGGSGVTGTFTYVCVYEEVDADGNWHQSGLSGVSASSGSITDDALTITTTPLAITSRAGATANARSTRVAFYRSLTGGAAPYYRLGTSINDTSSTVVTYTDTTSDATLSANAKLYSQPGVIGTAQDHRSPPPFQCITNYNGMLVGASGSDLWHSGQVVSGEGIWFNPLFQQPIPGDGDITALWVQDGTLFAAKRRDIFASNGEAPSDNGMSGGLGAPRRLAVDVGCIEARSPCATALGTVFQSERGIELLSRAQTVEWIGGDVQDTAAAHPICTSITVEPVSNTVLVELAASESGTLVGGNGRTLVYDISLRAWVSADRRTSNAGTPNKPSQSACMVYTGSAYRYAWIETGGVVQYETPATYTHADGSIVAKRAVSPWVKAAGAQGSQHVNKALVLAKYHTPHDLDVSFAYDYSATYKTARTYTAAQLLTLTSAIPMMQLEHGMHDDARCEAVRVKLADATPSSGSLGTGQGATWIALAFEVVPQTGAYKLPDAAR